MKEFLFVTNPKLDPRRVGFKVAVMATTLAKARRYIKRQGRGVLSYRKLVYAGEGPPENPERWLAVPLYMTRGL